MKNEVNEEIKEEVVEATVVEEEEVKEGFLTKAKNGLKKHGKKVAIGAAVAAAGVVGYMLGLKTDDDSEYIDAYDLDDSDSDSGEVTEN